MFCKYSTSETRVFAPLETFLDYVGLFFLHHRFESVIICDYISKIRWQHAQVMQSNEYENFYNIGQGESKHRKVNKYL
jgi:hypothetical protein